MPAVRRVVAAPLQALFRLLISPVAESSLPASLPVSRCVANRAAVALETTYENKPRRGAHNVRAGVRLDQIPDRTTTRSIRQRRLI